MRRFNFTIKGFLRVAFRVESAIHAGALVAISFAKSALVAAVLLIALFLFNANPAVVQFSDFLRFIQAPAFGLYTFFIVHFSPHALASRLILGCKLETNPCFRQFQCK